MAGGDFATTDFAAAAPYTYNHRTGGGAYNDRTVGDYKDVTEQLEGGQFAFGDIVTYFIQITMAGNPVDGNQTAEFDFRFLADSTGQSGAAQIDIVNVGVNYGDVENGDDGTAINPGLNQFGLDSGIRDDRQTISGGDTGINGSTATLINEYISGTPFTPGGTLNGTVRINDLEAGEKVVVRVDVLLAGQPGTSPTGNLQGALLAGRTYSPNGTLLGSINTGNQTVPFLKVGEIAGAGAPLLDIQKTVTADLTGADKTGVESLTINGGTTVRYLYNITNSGTKDLYDLNIVDDNGTPGITTDDFTVNLNNKLSGTLVNLDGEAVANDLAAGQSAIFYADIPINRTGSITNLATATGNNNLSGGNRVTLTDTNTANVQSEGTPALNIIKTANVTSVDNAGDVITYTYAVQNTGTLPLTGITVTDDNFTPGNTADDITLTDKAGDANSNNKLDVGETWTYTYNHSVTQAEIDAGADLVNIATADSDQTGPDTDSETVDVIQNPRLNIIKTADVSEVDAAGDVINYTYQVQNTGNVSLSGITVTDDNFTPSNTADDFTPTLSSNGNGDNILDVGETWTYAASHTVTQAQINAGNDLLNIATADSNETGPDTDDEKVNIQQNADIFLQKVADVSEVDGAGDVINYTFTLENTGNIALTGVTLTDNNLTSANPGDDFTPTLSSNGNGDNILDVGEIWTYTASHTVTQAEINAGNSLVNIATADSNETNPTNDDAQVDVIQTPGLNIVKTADVTQVDGAGDVINYTYTAQNTGNTTLTNVVVKDDNFTPANPNDDITLSVSGGDTNGNDNLDVGETWTYNYSYTVSQADIDNGLDLTNIATGDSDQTGPDTDDETVDVINTPDFEIVKTADVSQVNAAGQVINYTYTVTNTGNTSLTDVSLVDDNFTSGDTSDDITLSSPSGDNNNPGVLDVGETWTYTASHTVTQAEMDLGRPFVNVATADTAQTDPKSDDEIVNVQQLPNLEIVKTADVSEVDGAGDVINYTYTVQNTGNVTLTNVSVVDDNFTPGDTSDDVTLSSPTGDNSNPGVLDVGETWTYTHQYTVTQGDIDNGLSLTNVATADSDQSQPDTDDETVDVIQNPNFQIVKTADVASVDGSGDIINYTYTLTNTGNVTLTDISLVDDNFTAATGDDFTPTFSSGDNGNGLLDVGEVWTYNHQYTVTQADIDNGADLVNIATADTTQTDPKQDDATVDVIQNPNFTISKTADISEVDTAGAVITYTYNIANTGNVTLTNVTLIDDNFTPNNSSDDFAPTLTAGDLNSNGLLDVGETWTYTANYTVTQADIDNGADLVNVVTADTDQTGSKEDDYKVNVIQEADLFILKEADVTQVDNAGDVITYNYTVQNTGNVTLTNVTLTDDNFTPANSGDDFNPALIDKGDGNDDLNVQETWRYQDTYTVTQADMDAGVPLVNIATADSDQTGPMTDDATVNVTQRPNLDVTKIADVIEVDAAGDVINYLYTVSNTGNVTLSDITLVDDNFTSANSADDFNPAYSGGDNGNKVLDVGETWTYTHQYTVTQADIDSGLYLVNIATADSNQTDPESVQEIVDVIQKPSINIDKVTSNGIVTGDGIGVSAGEAIAWFYTVTNTGNLTLSDIAVNDDRIGAISNLTYNGNGDALLAPGESWVYRIDGTAISGSYQNIGTVTGNYSGGQITDSDVSSYTGIQAPGVRTPGFWINWTEVWDGNSGNDTRFAGRSGFPNGDILLSPYSASAEAPKVLDPVTGNYTLGLLVGDYNRDGITNNGEKTIFYTLDEAKSIIAASNKVQQDKRYTLDRSLIASWLNYNAFNPAPVNDIDNGIEWIQQHSPDENGDNIGDGNLVLGASSYAVSASSAFWNSSDGSLPSGNSIHTALDRYNNGLWAGV